MKAKSNSGYGSGWHFQSKRHSMARKTGRAGGVYSRSSATKLSNSFVEFHKNHPEFGFGQAQKEWSKYQKLRDSDGDGVPDSKDCQPYNPHAQDTYDLRPIHDSRKSFYGKARIETDSDKDHYTQKLYSYGTLVAEIKDGKPIVYGTYSATTLRHIKEFLAQNHFKAETSKQIMKDYAETKEHEEQREKESEERAKKDMKMIAGIAKLGEVFGKTPAEKNEWKKRMLKAGLERKGLSFPEDWDALPEAEKEKRLNQAIKTISEDEPK